MRDFNAQNPRLTCWLACVMQEPTELVQAVTAACSVACLQPVPALVSKCLQLQETMAVRFGVMLVGPAGMPTTLCS